MSTKQVLSVACLVIGILGRADAAEPAAKPAPDAVAKEVAAITRTTVIPCPTPKPVFDHTKIDRTLKEPKFVSEKPAYRFFAFGPEGKSIMAMVLDESQGTGKGYDVLYMDLNLDRDITAADEKFVCKSAAAPTKAVVPERLQCAVPAGGASCPLPDAASAPVPAAIWCINPVPADPAPLKRKLDIADPQFDYDLECQTANWYIHSALKSGDWHARLSLHGRGNVWSQDKAAAPVYRFGGTEWTFNHNGGNERTFNLESLRGQSLKTGEALAIEAVRPFFAGSSPAVLFECGSCWVHGGYTHARWSLESLERPSEANRLFLAGETCCGGSHVDRILVPADFPPGRAEVVLSLDTPDAYLGRVVQRYPITIENPDYGKPIPDLDMTAALRKEFPGDTVVELYQGADLSAWSQGEYDGARDVYLGGEGETGEPTGSLTLGNHINYSYDARNILRVGTVRKARTLIRFDLSVLPRDTHVKKAQLQFYAAQVKPKVDRTTSVRLLKKRWHDDLSTAQVAFGGHQEAFCAYYNQMPFPLGEEVKWEKPFALGDSDRVQEPVGTIAFAATGWDGLDLTGTVQKWVNGDAANQGVILELANPQQPDYVVDVEMVSSDNPCFPARRPRLVLVLEKGFKPVPAPAIAEKDPDIEKARMRAKAENKLLVCNVLSGKSVTSATFQQMLKHPGVEAFLSQRFVEIRLDADKPEHRKVLDFYGVKYAPTALVIRPGATPEQDVFERFEPLRWNTRFGWSYAKLEAPESYTLRLEWLRTKGSAWLPWRRLADGTLYRLGSHLCGSRFDGNGGMVLK